MLKIENTEVIGWKAAIRGMRNPMNSWERSDSFVCVERSEMTNEEIVATCGKCPTHGECDIYDLESHFIVGSDDLDLMKRLRNAGTDHRKFMRMITVYADITGPLYWWKEFDTYKVGTVANSCSTMHKIAAKVFTPEDFSAEHLLSENVVYFGRTLERLNNARELYLETKDKKYWWQMIQLLPSSYNQRRTVMLNYEVLANMYKSRKNHKLDEWHTFCNWIRALPYSWLITGELDVQEDRNEKA